MTALASVLDRFRRGPSPAPEGSAAGGQALHEVACLAPEAALARLRCRADGLDPGQVAERLASFGPNQVAHQARHTILRELVGRSINPLNLLLLSLATASYFLGDQRAAIVIAVMVVLSISLGFIQEHRSNRAADDLRRMVLTKATVRRRARAPAPDPAQEHSDVPIDQLVPGDIVLLVGRRHDPGRPAAHLGQGSVRQPVVAHRRGHAAGEDRGRPCRHRRDPVRSAQHLLHGQRRGERHRLRRGGADRRAHRLRPGGRQHRATARADQLRQGHQPVHLADAGLHRGDGAAGVPDQRPDQGRLAARRCCSRWRWRSGSRPRCCR